MKTPVSTRSWRSQANTNPQANEQMYWISGNNLGPETVESVGESESFCKLLESDNENCNLSPTSLKEDDSEISKNIE